MITADLSWILDDLVNFPSARNAVVLSADGLRMAASSDVTDELADHISATASGMQSLSRNAATFVGYDVTPWQQTMIQYRGGYLFLVAASDRSYLVASAQADVDIVAFSDRMAKVVERLGPALGVAPRNSEDERG
ncbi:roadblock/LC7 domain-containing protein [Streptomyces sp. NPDC055692]|uniref:roadblock/LC7 domain-containing protein n=1 Tax=Streptomyces sp. NPDC055692 TaxID=3155683 RepID=UPI0034219905